MGKGPASAGPSFGFAVCQLGVEKALKDELGRVHPNLRPAFQRPGFLTFRSDAPLSDDFVVEAALARAYARTVGRADDRDSLVAHVREAARSGATLHVFPRDTAVPGEYDEHLRAPLLDEADALAATLREALPDVELGRAVVEGGRVVSVVLAPGEPTYVGVHTHHRGHSPHPGGRLDQRLPADAPSRAYLKLVEGFDFADEPFVAGRVACEIGASPGGAIKALLDHGLEAVGIDPGAMDPSLLAPGERRRGRFHHLAMPVGAVTSEHLPPTVDYLLLDVNLAPQVAFRSALRIAAMRRDTLRALIFTLKMNDYAYLENLASFRQRAAELGFSDVRVRQLASNRREVCFVAKRASRLASSRPNR